MHVIAAFFLFAASNQDKKTQKEVGVSLWKFTMNANREDLWEGENLWKNRNSRLDFARKHLFYEFMNPESFLIQSHEC